MLELATSACPTSRTASTAPSHSMASTMVSRGPIGVPRFLACVMSISLYNPISCTSLGRITEITNEFSSAEVNALPGTGKRRPDAKYLRLGVHEDSTNRTKVAELLRFHTSKSGDEQIGSRKYVDRMKEGQNDIYYITGESIAAVSSSPTLGTLRKSGLEMLYMADPVEEYAVQQLKEFDGKKLKPTMKEGLDIEDEDVKKKLEELKAEFVPVTKLMKEVLGDKVEKVLVCSRMADSPCVLTTSEYGWSANMERNMKAQALRDNSSCCFLGFEG